MDKVEQKNFKSNLRWKYSFMALSALVIMLISFICFTKEDAWLFLGFSGTALSIVLSVIAILITLIDVAGQKQQVVDITNSAKELKEVLELNKEINEEYKITLEKLVNETLIEKIEILNDVLSEIPDSINQDTSKEEIEEVNKNLAEAKKKIDFINKNSSLIEMDNLIKTYNNTNSYLIPNPKYVTIKSPIVLTEEVIEGLKKYLLNFNSLLFIDKKFNLKVIDDKTLRIESKLIGPTLLINNDLNDLKRQATKYLNERSDSN